MMIIVLLCLVLVDYFYRERTLAAARLLACDRRFSDCERTSRTKACRWACEPRRGAWCVARRRTELRVWKISGQLSRGSDAIVLWSSWLGFGDGRMSCSRNSAARTRPGFWDSRSVVYLLRFETAAVVSEGCWVRKDVVKGSLCCNI